MNKRYILKSKCLSTGIISTVAKCSTLRKATALLDECELKCGVQGFNGKAGIAFYIEMPTP